MNIVFDKTSIDLLSLVITGSGVFAALAEHYSKELTQMYLGSNPHAVKSNIINSVITKLFLSVAVIAAFIQAGSIIFEKRLLPRQFDEQDYLLFFLVSCVLMFVILKATVFLAYKIAKRIWYPRAVASKKASFVQIEKAVTDSPTDEVKLKRQEHNLSDIETLLEIKPSTRDVVTRTEFLSSLFKAVKLPASVEDDE